MKMTKKDFLIFVLIINIILLIHYHLNDNEL